MAEVVVLEVEDCSEAGTTGARSSMRKPPGKIVAQCTVCVTPASRRGRNRTIWVEFYPRFSRFEPKNVIEITRGLPLNGSLGKSITWEGVRAA